MAVVRAIEESESSWSSNFQLLEDLVMGNQPKVAHKPSKPIFEPHADSKEGKKCYFAKNTNHMNAMLTLKIMPIAVLGGGGEKNLTCCTMFAPPAF